MHTQRDDRSKNITPPNVSYHKIGWIRVRVLPTEDDRDWSIRLWQQAEHELAG